MKWMKLSELARRGTHGTRYQLMKLAHMKGSPFVQIGGESHCWFVDVEELDQFMMNLPKPGLQTIKRR